MTRSQYIPVTEIPVLIPCSRSEQDGVANFYGGDIVREGSALLVCYQPIRALRDDDLNSKSHAGKRLWKGLEPPEQQRLLGLIELRKALEAGDLLATEKLESMYKKLAPDIRRCGWPPPSPVEDATRGEVLDKLLARSMSRSGTPKAPGYLPLLLSRALRRARLVLWWHDNQRRFLPAIYCPDVATALYARALVGIVGGKALVICPRCGKPFVQPRSDQDYCSMRCREAHRVARWRASKGRRKMMRKSGKGR